MNSSDLFLVKASGRKSGSPRWWETDVTFVDMYVVLWYIQMQSPSAYRCKFDRKFQVSQ
ncbi:hypothetical protein M404DRAFT_999509 [Pisolithus tinctorius Marx 270]|uniref:Uncharacterized protein n=1 Tax=Pisolithus tinctorius Marx 270 TaxID=870435 RepID=A0A0C3NY76_PISTI|nr:hypothetical protein M404DRAFT_999509 [Pisolithus tinctorius Marx 270]